MANHPLIVLLVSLVKFDPVLPDSKSGRDPIHLDPRGFPLSTRGRSIVVLHVTTTFLLTCQIAAPAALVIDVKAKRSGSYGVQILWRRMDNWGPSLYVSHFRPERAWRDFFCPPLDAVAHSQHDIPVYVTTSGYASH